MGFSQETIAMAQASAIIWLVAGASLLGVVTRVTIPPATWLALTFLLHASRSLPDLMGPALVWLAIYAALALGSRGMLPLSGPGYFAIVAVSAVTVTLPFLVERFVALRF